MPKCGSQVVLCNLPVRFDTYIGCSHGCRYCFVQKKTSIQTIERGEGTESLRAFISGQRSTETKWCDWDIPLHWGGMSDPFQPIEKLKRYSYDCLKILAETKYPFVVSTKGALAADDEYLELLSKCNVVLQISMVCSKYDQLEKGAPTYEERLNMCRKIAPKVKRLIVRVQPYMLEVFDDVMKNIPRLADAGVYGVTFEGMKFYKSKPGMVKVGGDCCYPLPLLRSHFTRLREQCHKHGMKFFSGENRLRAMGDGMTCCGIDGLEGFKGNPYNICMMLNGKAPDPTEIMQQPGTADCFKSLNQTAGVGRRLKNTSFAGMMQKDLAEKKAYYKTTFGFDE